MILEEIGMYEDQPSFIAYEAAMKTHFDGHPLGQSILGSNSQHLARSNATRWRVTTRTTTAAATSPWPSPATPIGSKSSNWPTATATIGRPAARPAPDRRSPPEGGNLGHRQAGSTQQHVMQMAPAPVGDQPPAATRPSCSRSSSETMREAGCIGNSSIPASPSRPTSLTTNTTAAAPTLTYVCADARVDRRQPQADRRYLRRRQCQGRH